MHTRLYVYGTFIPRVLKYRLRKKQMYFLRPLEFPAANIAITFDSIVGDKVIAARNFSYKLSEKVCRIL